MLETAHVSGLLRSTSNAKPRVFTTLSAHLRSSKLAAVWGLGFRESEARMMQHARHSLQRQFSSLWSSESRNELPIETEDQNCTEGCLGIMERKSELL